MSVDARRLRTSPELRWRRAKGWIFAGLAGSALALGTTVVLVLVGTTVAQSLRLTAMDASARAGLSLSLRSLTVDGKGTSYVTVSRVGRDSPSAKIGIEQGDALTRVDDRIVRDVPAVWSVIDERRENTLAVQWVPNVETLIGELRPVPVPGERGRFRVRVSRVTSGSPAARAGIEVDDVLLSVAGLPVTGTRQAWQAMVVATRQGDDPPPVELERNEETRTIRLETQETGELHVDSGFFRAVVAFLSRLDEPRYPEHAGLASAFLGSIYVIFVTAVIAFPLGIAAAVYLEEYAPRNVLTETLQVLISNLAGIPSVVYGIIGLEILARHFSLGRSILAGGGTLALLILPVMIIACREALRTVPPWIREAGYGVGATQWQVVRHQVLPYALPGMFTAMILSISRAIGEAAPLLLLGAFLYVNYVPDNLMDTFTVIPLQIFAWATKPQAGFGTIASVAIVVLLALLLLLNLTAILLRNRYQRRWS